MFIQNKVVKLHFNMLQNIFNLLPIYYSEVNNSSKVFDREYFFVW